MDYYSFAVGFIGVGVLFAVPVVLIGIVELIHNNGRKSYGDKEE